MGHRRSEITNTPTNGYFISLDSSEVKSLEMLLGADKVCASKLVSGFEVTAN